MVCNISWNNGFDMKWIYTTYYLHLSWDQNNWRIESHAGFHDSEIFVKEMPKKGWINHIYLYLTSYQNYLHVVWLSFIVTCQVNTFKRFLFLSSTKGSSIAWLKPKEHKKEGEDIIVYIPTYTFLLLLEISWNVGSMFCK